MEMHIFKTESERYDFEHVFFYGECEKTLAYAERNSSIAGVSECIKKMLAERSAYNSDITGIVESVKENEMKKYRIFDTLTKIRQISAWSCVVFLVLSIICGICSLSILRILGIIFSLLLLIAFVVFAITKIGEMISGALYKRFAQDIMKRIRAREREFIQICQRYYTEIDNLYLGSLTLAEREAVLNRRMTERMYREQAEHNKKIEQKADKQLNEMERIRKSAERTEGGVQNVGQMLSEWRDERHGRY